MQSVKRFVAILSLAGFSALGSQETCGQEGGFQVPLNAEPIVPTPPGSFTGSPDFFLWHDPVFPSRQVKALLWKPKPGEHLGDYLIADELPWRPRAIPVSRLPETSLPLPPHNGNEIGWKFGGAGSRHGVPAPPNLGDLPPKTGECLGEYTIAAELPPRYPAAAPNLPTMAVPPACTLDTGDHRVSSGPPSAAPTTPPTCLFNFHGWYVSDRPQGAVPTAPPAPNDRTEFHFTGPCEVKLARQMPDGSFSNAGASKDRNFKHGDVFRLRITSAQPGKPVRRFYPSMEVPYTNSKTETYVKHASVPVAFTQEEFARAKAGEVVVKVIYLPNPDQQDFSTVVGAEDVSSVGLKSGVDPIAEAKRRGTILAIIRMGDADFEPRNRPRSDDR